MLNNFIATSKTCIFSVATNHETRELPKTFVSASFSWDAFICMRRIDPPSFFRRNLSAVSAVLRQKNYNVKRLHGDKSIAITQLTV